MINPVLHTNKVVQRTHCVQIVRSFSPPNVEDRTLSKPRRVRNITKNIRSVYNLNNSVVQKGIRILVVDITVECQDLYVIRLVVLTNRPETINNKAIVLVQIRV